MSRKKEKEFRSSGILLQMAKEEYAAEENRASGLDGKASFFITVIIAVATIFIPIIPFNKLPNIFTNGECSQKWLTGIFLAGVLIAFVLLIIAFKYLYDAYKLKDYKRPSLECIDTESYHIIPNDQLNKGLCTHYKGIVDKNVETNNNKANSVKVGIRLCGIGFLILMAATIGILIVIGG